MDNDGNPEELGDAMGSLDQATLMGVLDKNLTLFLMLLSFVFALGGVFLAVKYLHQQKMKDIITTRKKFDWGRV
ncbi:MAG TPA: CPBP family intramembrane metalloprotease domain-containing protein, partial [Leeuwenhoekiella sp.]|nr:CPBP family intramembrane metalloprotease domain-containing protein [Leeuwenhoekiella sp.]